MKPINGLVVQGVGKEATHVSSPFLIALGLQRCEGGAESIIGPFFFLLLCVCLCLVLCVVLYLSLSLFLTVSMRSLMQYIVFQSSTFQRKNVFLHLPLPLSSIQD